MSGVRERCIAWSARSVFRVMLAMSSALVDQCCVPGLLHGDLDAVLLPVWGRPAPLAAEIPEIVTTPALFAEAVRYMVPFNYADLPLVVVPAAVSRCRGGGACPYALRPRSFQLVGRNESILLRLAAAYELERGELEFPLDPKADAGAATLLFGGALLTLTAVVAGAFFLVLV